MLGFTRVRSAWAPLAVFLPHTLPRTQPKKRKSRKTYRGNGTAHKAINPNNGDPLWPQNPSKLPHLGNYSTKVLVFCEDQFTLPIHRQGYKRQQSQPMTNVDIYGMEALKKPRLDAYKEDVLDHRFNRKLHLEKSLIELQEKNYELKTLIEHQRQQNQIHKHISFMGLEERAAVQAELSDWNPAQFSSLPYFDSDICIRRLMQYLYHMRRRPINNDIDYWRKFSSEYYAPCAKQRWCLSRCKNVSQQALDLFTETAMESWCCSICGSKSSKGFEVTYEALPRLFKTNFESGMLDEIMFLGLPQEHIFPSGLIMLEYGKVVQESVYEKFRIVHEGKLRVIFRGDLKIVYWEFCAQCHEEFVQHQLIARQINDFVEAAQKYKSGIDNFDGSLSKDMHSSCNIVFEELFKVEGRKRDKDRPQWGNH
ncbi:unnamed protein product [Cuscuta campestris]|uniref:Uncharacterized protein n=1 Tax=Cuscuta campestris TaxID=132261 RepID=A0A484NLG9_9ASTE|nr:unnamed protein product [Cuscuta campestris]